MPTGSLASVTAPEFASHPSNRAAIRLLGLWTGDGIRYLDAAGDWRPGQRRRSDLALEALLRLGSIVRSGEANPAREMTLRKFVGIALRAGLERRIGERLTATEQRLVLSLRSGADSDGGLTFCAACAVVHQARPQSERCAACERHPRPVPRLDRLPSSEMLDGRIAYLVLRDERGRVVYEGRCADCARGFTAKRGNTRKCLNCRNGAGRMRRARGGGTPTKVYRYLGCGELESARAFTMSVNRGDSDQVTLEGRAGNLTTTDAEAARVLDAHPLLERVR